MWPVKLDAHLPLPLSSSITGRAAMKGMVLPQETMASRTWEGKEGAGTKAHFLLDASYWETQSLSLFLGTTAWHSFKPYSSQVSKRFFLFLSKVIFF